MFSYKEVTGGLLIAVLSVNMLLLSFLAWQYIQFARCLRHCIRQSGRLMIALSRTEGKMDCDKFIAELRSAQGAGPVKEAPPAAVGTAAMPDAP